ncbi:MAG: KOW domain-containing RNA-binding protein [Clostridia bacterium]|nr:KOW domain-containing RNA-binding protein [Clostridia bacterium]
MTDCRVGDVVRSTKGHDAGGLFLVLEAGETHLLLADGKGRKLSHPKRKSRRHVERLQRPESLEVPASDRALRKALSALAESQTR